METATKLRQCPNCFGEYEESLDTCPFCGYTYVSQSNQYPLALTPGRILAGRYILGRVLGQGGFGITYLAWDAREKTRVAIKEFFPENLVMRQPEATQVQLLTADRGENFQFGREQFLAEARTLAQFVHNPNIVDIYSYFEENGTAYFAMEYVEGESLKEYLKEKGGRLSWEETVQLLVPVMDALAAVHAKGMIHRDVKPDNIFITRDGHTKLLDFGSARYSLGDRSRSLDVVLTAGYAPKEQYARHSRQGPYTDVYSLAACFYACITGLVPTESVERTENDDLPLPSARGARLPAEAEDAILKGLSIKAEERWQTMADFKAHLLPAAREEDAGSTGGSDQDGGSGPAVEGGTSETQTDGSSSEIMPKKKPLIVFPKISGERLKAFKRPQILVACAAIVGLGILAGYQLIPFEATDKSIRQDGREVGLYTGTVVAGRPSGEGRMEYTDGGIYDGSWKNGQRAGQGTMSYSNKDLYVGNWAMDVENGEGTMNYASGDVYEGEWLDGQRSGDGTMNYANGDVYEGGWRDGQRSGEGSLAAADGIRVYSGSWLEDEMDGPILLTISFNEEQGWVSTLESTYEKGEVVGTGSYTFVNGSTMTAQWDYVENQQMEDGSVYTGLLVDGVPSGYGSFVYEDESSYTGELSYGERSGVGLMDEGDDYYIGEWENDRRNGYGYRHYYDGSVFEGNWTDNAPDGQGSYTYVNGEVAEGDWSYVENLQITLVRTGSYNLPARYATYEGLALDGVPCGFGMVLIELWSDDHNALYLGEWKDGYPWGDGTYLSETGDTLSGEWSYEQEDDYGSMVLNGQANGMCMREESNGVYCGEYRDGAANGYGYMQFDSGNEYTGYWENGSRQGYGVFEWTSGERYEGEWQDNAINGTGVFYWPNGDWYEGGFKDGDKHGQGVYHWADGNTRTGTWSDGVYQG